MTYYLATHIPGPIDEAIERVEAALKEEGFGSRFGGHGGDLRWPPSRWRRSYIRQGHEATSPSADT